VSIGLLLFSSVVGTAIAFQKELTAEPSGAAEGIRTTFVRREDEVLYEKLLLALEAGECLNALSIVETLISKHGKSPDLCMRRALCMFWQGRWSVAQGDLRVALWLGVDRCDMPNQIPARLCASMERTIDSLEDLKKKQKAQDRLFPVPRTDIQQSLLHELTDALRKEDYGTSLSLAVRLLRDFPHSPLLHHVRSLCLLSDGKHEEAASAMATALASSGQQDDGFVYRIGAGTRREWETLISQAATLTPEKEVDSNRTKRPASRRRSASTERPENGESSATRR
jgi:uncharacterized protein HemY